MYFKGLIHRERLVVKMDLKYNCRKVMQTFSSMQINLYCFTTYFIKNIFSWGGEIKWCKYEYQKD